MRRMNRISLTLSAIFSLTLFNSCTSNKPISTVTIEGHIDNFEKYADQYVTVQIYINDLSSGTQLSHSGFIDKDGTYQIDFEKYYPQDIYFRYGNRGITIFVDPGDKLITNINADQFINREANNAIFFSGDNKITNENIYLYQTRYYNEIPQQYRGDPDFHAQKLTPEKYKDYLYNRKKVHTDYLNKFIAQNDVSKAFIKWAKYDIEYNCAEALIDYYRQQRQVRIRNNVPEASIYDTDSLYYDFFTEFKLDNPSANICSAYFYYLIGYNEYHIQKLFQKYGLEDVDDLYQARFKQIIDTCHGFCKEVLLTQLFSNVLETRVSDALDENYQLYLANVSTDYLRNHVIKKYQLIHGNKKVTKAPDNAFLTDLTDIYEADKILDTISNKHNGKVIYIDCWATWCPHCLEEMPLSMKLQEYFNKQDVGFVYLCMDSPKPIWKDTVSKLKLKGDHYFLDNKQSEIIKPLLNVVSFPHYVLIGKNGIILKIGAERPSVPLQNQLNQNLINQISELLKG